MGHGKIEASVIVPAFNAAEFLGEQLLALARQDTDVSWELIVADNGSTDGTLAVVHRFAAECHVHVPMRVIDASDRAHAIGARNAGAAVAVGELLLFADADDVVDDRWVEEMVRALRMYPFVGGKLEVIELNEADVSGWRMPVAQDDLPIFAGCPWVMGCNFGCTAAAFSEVGGFQEAIDGWNDVDLSLAMGAHGMPAVFAERAIVHYRYRREPRQAVRQMWRWGRQTARRSDRHLIEPPTFLDASVQCYRGTKLAVRERLTGRRPVRQVVDVTHVLAEASIHWRNPAFWHPRFRLMEVANPVVVQRERLRRAVSVLFPKG